MVVLAPCASAVTPTMTTLMRPVTWFGVTIQPHGQEQHLQGGPDRVAHAEGEEEAAGVDVHRDDRDASNCARD